MSSSSSSSSSSRATGSSSGVAGSGVVAATVSGASYDQLLWQVELLKMENSTLRQELQHNSTHLSKLETEASNMKEVLKQLQGTIEEESSDTPSQLDVMERFKEISMDPASLAPVKLRAPPPSAAQGPHGAGFPKRGAPLPTSSSSSGPVPTSPCDANQTSPGYLEQLQQERSLLLAELDKEEKEKAWYYDQLQNLTKRIDSLPLADNFSLQTDMTRRQLEFEARQLRGAMEEQLGSCQDMERRALARLSRIQQIEKDILRAGQRLHPRPDDKGEGVQACPDSATTPSCAQVHPEQDAASEVSSAGGYSVPRRLTSHLGTKVEMVYSLLSMLGTHDKDDMSRTLLAMSSSQDSCIAMRQSGCLPLLIQLLHGSDKDSLLLGNSRGSKEARARASAALHNIVHSRPDDKRARREARVLHLLEQVRVYCEACWVWQEAGESGTDPDQNPVPSPGEHQICPAVCVLMKLSFDEEHRHAMNELGGLQAIAELLQADCEVYGLTAEHQSITLRRYAGMALTNLTFGDVANKATLCSMKGCMRAMVAQLKSDSEDLQQVVASVLRNLSWRADASSKKTLREVGCVAALMSCGLHVQKESTLKSVLSALWNLSAHCSDNKAELCGVAGALGFLVRALAQRGPASAALAVVESAGGILRNVSSLVATNQTYRQILRDNGCLATLLQHLRSPSLTVVSNACGTLWNLSARDPRDQEALWEMGAVAMLRNLVHSRHKMIAMGSAAALRNLLANRPAKYAAAAAGAAGSGGEAVAAPSLQARKHKALIEELDAQRQQLAETFDGLENLGGKTGTAASSPSGHHHHHHRRRHRQTSPSSPAHRHLQQRGGRSRHHRGDCEDGARSPYANTPVLSSPPARGGGGGGQKRAAPPPALAWPAASSDSLNSVGSADGYGRRPTGVATDDDDLLDDREEHGASAEEDVDEEEEEEQEAVRASGAAHAAYRRYPADLAHKIHSANSMADAADAELDTPINYSLKYSDEQLHSGRQSPAPAAPPRGSRERKEEEAEEGGVGRQEEAAMDERSRRRPYQVPYRGGGGSHGDRPHHPQHQQQRLGSDDRTTNYGDRHAEQEPIDYSLKYAGHASPGRAAAASSSGGQKLRPLAPPAALAPPGAKGPGGGGGAGMNQETLQTYCVEGTPICFSRGSSLSSLSSGDDDDDRRRDVRRRAAGGDVADRRGRSIGATLPIGEKEEREGGVSSSEALQVTSLQAGQQQFVRLPRRGGGDGNHHHPPHHYHGGHQQQPPAVPKSPPLAPSSQPSSALASALETPLMFSRCTSLSSLDSFGSPSIASSLPSEPCSGAASGVVSPSELPDSPGQTMPPSRAKTPPLQRQQQQPSAALETLPVTGTDSELPCLQLPAATDALSSGSLSMRPQQSHAPNGRCPGDTANGRGEEEEDFLLHFATESTPHGFSRASSLSALSVDEPFIPSADRSAPAVDAAAPSALDRLATERAGPQLDDDVDAVVDDDDDDDDDIFILKACINSAMPTKSSRRPKKPTATATVSAMSRPPQPDPPGTQTVATTTSSTTTTVSVTTTATNRKPSLLPVYKPLPQHRRQRLAAEEETPRVYCVEDTPLSFSAATSLSDLTIESPPTETRGATSAKAAAEDGRGLPVTVATGEERHTEEGRKLPANDEEGDDILAECISAAMPKPRPLPLRKTLPLRPGGGHHHPHPPHHQSAAPPDAGTDADAALTQQRESERRRKPTSPVKPMVMQRAGAGHALQPPGPANPAEQRMRRRFAYDSPRHYTPIEGTPCCFSRNDSLSSLDFDDEEEEEGRPRHQEKAEAAPAAGEDGGDAEAETWRPEPSQKPPQTTAAVFPRSKEAELDVPSLRSGAAADDGRRQRFAVEDTPVCFSRNSSLSSLSDIMDQENNNVRDAVPSPPPPPQDHGPLAKPPAADVVASPPGETVLPQSLPEPPATNPQAHAPPPTVPSNPAAGGVNGTRAAAAAGYAPQAFHVEDTPVCFSRNSSLSSLSIDSEDDLLQECISSAMPKRKHHHHPPQQAPRATAAAPPSTPPSRPSRPHAENDAAGAEGERAKEEDEDAKGGGTAVPGEEEEAFDWKAIQEGANSVVSSLHQALTATDNGGPGALSPSLRRRDSVSSASSGDDSDSVLSLRSGLSLSLGSPFRVPRPPAAAATVDTMEDEEAPLRGGPVAGEEEEEEEELEGEGPARRQQTPASRGRARILRPGENGTLEERRRREEEERAKALKGGKKVYRSLLTGRPRPQFDAPPSANAGLHAAPASSSPRGRALKAALAAPRQAGKTSTNRKAEPVQADTPPGRGRGGASSSRSGSRDSTPSRRPAPSRPAATSSSSSTSSRLSCPSPGRPAKQSCLPRATSVPPPAPAGGGPPQKKSSSGTRASSSGGSSETERPALVRQSTFIKEAPGKRRTEEAPPPTSCAATRPAVATAADWSRSAVSSSSSSSSLNNNNNENAPAARRQETAAPNRSHSESPSRPQESRLSRTGTWKREGGGRGGEAGGGGKHASSLPRVGTWKRAGSSSSLLSASSESSSSAVAKGDEEEEAPPQRRGAASIQRRGTWRKVKDGAADSVAADQEDVWVRMEDCPVNSPRPSSSSSSLVATNSPPVIGGPSPPKTGVTVATTPRPAPNANLNLRSKSRESLDVPPAAMTTPVRGGGPFERVVPGKPYADGTAVAVAARVSPFNYVPSPRKSGAADSPPGQAASTPSSNAARPSLIPSPVALGGAGGKKRQQQQQTPPSPSPSTGERGSYIVTSV